jgi:hypothetical protein
MFQEVIHLDSFSFHFDCVWGSLLSTLGSML